MLFEFRNVEVGREAPGPFVEDHHAALVGDLKRDRDDRHMRGAQNDVSEIAAAENEIGQRFLLRLGGAVEAAVVAGGDVLAEKIDLLAVQIEPAVLRMEFAVTEAGARGGNGLPFPAMQRERQKIEVRALHRPLLRVVEFQGDTPGIDAGFQGEASGDAPGDGVGGLFHRIGDDAVESAGPGLSGVVDDRVIGLDAAHRETGSDEDLRDPQLGLERERDILPDAALDVADPPLGTVSVRRFRLFPESGAEVGEDAERENIPARLRGIGRVDFKRREISVVAADLLPVQEHLRIVADHVEIQHDPAVFSSSGVRLKTGTVVAADVRLFGGLLLRIFLVPVERYGNVVPLRVVECGSGILPVKPVVGRNRRAEVSSPEPFPDSVQGTGLDEISDPSAFLPRPAQ